MEMSHDPNDQLRADETEVDDLYQLKDIGLALRLNALLESTEIRASRSRK